MFQETANTENFQARYIITHPATGSLDCPEGKKYLENLKERRKDELEMLTWLTGKGYNDWDIVSAGMEEKMLPAKDTYAVIAATIAKAPKKDSGILLATLGTVGMLSLAGFSLRNLKNK